MATWETLSLLEKLRFLQLENTRGARQPAYLLVSASDRDDLCREHEEVKLGGMIFGIPIRSAAWVQRGEPLAVMRRIDE